ncbi:MAG: TonB-dependent receptor [Rhodothalassiaceae bacterium]
MTKSTFPLRRRLFLSATACALCGAATAQDRSDRDRLSELEAEHIALEEIVVTASPIARSVGQSITATTVLDKEELSERVANSIGETLRLQPGISATAFGAGASRPIIRGVGGDRIRVLQDGVGSFDAAQTSPDHAVPIEPALAQRIEVFRGPASLLYGSSAAGGVVNVITGRIPQAIPEDGVDLALRYSHSTVDNGDELAGGANVAIGNLVLHGEAFWRNADDYEIPGLTASDFLVDALAAEAAANGESFDADEEFESGFVPNSDVRTNGGSGGLSWVFDGGDVEGFLGFSVSVLNTNYGVPEGILTEEDLEEEEEEGEGEEEEEEGEEGIRIDLEQVRYDLEGEIRGDLGFLQAVKLRVGYGDYRHVELEGAEVGTLFENDEVEGRLEFVAQETALFGGTLRTAFGGQGRFRDFAAVGAEAFVPPSEQIQVGAFVIQELTLGRWLFDLGARYEFVDNSTDTFIEEEDGTPIAVDNDFDVFSISGGLGYLLTDKIFIGANGFRTERAPSLEEQFSFGPHLATQSFEIGDPDLAEEVARGVEVTVRGEFGPVTALLNGFYTNYDGFIFESETGAILDGLPVFQFTAADTEFRGFEAEVDVDLGVWEAPRIGPMKFAAHGQADHVRATSSGLDDPDQPRIPPISTLLGLSGTNEYVSLRGEVEFTTSQFNTAPFELPTDSFVFLNLFLTVRPFGDDLDLALDLRARNLNDDEGRVHASFLKDTTPLPGRDIRLSVRFGF